MSDDLFVRTKNPNNPSQLTLGKIMKITKMTPKDNCVDYHLDNNVIVKVCTDVTSIAQILDNDNHEPLKDTRGMDIYSVDYHVRVSVFYKELI